MRLFFRRWAWPLSSCERNSECFSIPRDVGQFHAPNFVGTVWGWPLPVPEFDVGESDWAAQSTDLNPAEHFWDELEQRLRARPSRPTSVCDLTNGLLEEWSKIPINTPKPCGKPSQKS